MPNKVLENLGIVMMGVGDGLAGTSNLSNYQRMKMQRQADEKQAERERQRQETELQLKGFTPMVTGVTKPGGYSPQDLINIEGKVYQKPPLDPLEQYKQVEAAAKFGAWQKMQKGEELTTTERFVMGIKEKDEAPSKYELYKQSRDEIFKANGGSMFSGITVENKDKFENDVTAKYQQLISQFYPQEQTKKTSKTDDLIDMGKNLIGGNVPSSNSQAASGKIFKNPKTGQRIQLKDGQWVPIR